MDLEVQEVEENLKEFSRRQLFGFIKECTERSLDTKINYMVNRLVNLTHCPEDEISQLTRKLRYFKSEFKQKWAKASRKEERFLEDNETWLAGTIQLTMWSKQKAGRPAKAFEECSERSKRRKTKELREQVPEATLTYAAQMSLRSAGKSDASAIIKEITTTPTRATKVRRVINKARNTPIHSERLTIKKALSVFVEAGLTRSQYNILRNASPTVYPCYSLLQKAKKACYPSPDAYRVTDTCAEIRLQDLLDHTASRLCEYLEEVLLTISDEDKENLHLISKWGCDGSQQQQFKQKFENNTDSDSNIFQSSFVPIRLTVKSQNQEKIIWQNPVCSSPRFCRPIRIRFLHETSDIKKDEIRYVEDQVKNLNKSEVQINIAKYKIKHTFLLTMVDAKVCNAATDTLSTMRCYICKATSKDFNKLEQQRQENPETFKFGLSILHARIRLFESILHLSYKLPVKKWQCRTAADKQLVKETKLRIQQEFKEELSLLVDIPKAGFGNTNDGNTSRRFFADPEIAARITGVDLEFIKRIKILLEVVSSSHKIDTKKFTTFCKETAQLYVNLYNWHPMTPTLHKMLAHGPTIIEHVLIPIGQLSEEAAEARNKHFRQYRQDYSRKFSRLDCNMDIINRLLLSSDPLLSSEKPASKRKRQPFSKEALEFLLPMESSADEEHVSLDQFEDADDSDSAQEID